MKSTLPAVLSLCLAVLMIGCKKDVTTTSGTTGPTSQTSTYPNDSLVSDASFFYIVADVEGVPGQSKLYVESDYYSRSGASFFQCFGGGYSSYTVTMDRNANTPTHWINQIVFDFDSGMVHNGGSIVRTGDYTPTAHGQTYANHYRITMQTTHVIYDDADATKDNHFTISSIEDGGTVMKGHFNCTLRSNSGETAVLKNGVFKIRM